MKNRVLPPFVILILAARCTAAQQPIITTIVNAASGPPASQTITPGSIATIFGTELASEPVTAESVPLPTELGATVVTVDDTPAPLLYVSPGQINFQISWRYRDRPPGAYWSAKVVVSTAGGSSDAYPLSGWQAAPGIFTEDGSGCGQGLIRNVADDGSTSQNCPANSIPPGGTVTIFALGLGYAPGAPPDGMATSIDQPISVEPFTSVSIGGESPLILFEGLAPGLVGVYQINATLANDTPEGCSVPLLISSGFARSQLVAISVHSGGGQCVDSESPTTADLEWRRVLATGINPPPPPESFTAQFTAINQPSFIDVPRPSIDDNLLPSTSGCHCYYDPLPLARSCPPFTNVALDAGALTLQIPGGNSISLPPSSSGGTLAYEADLPANTITAGSFWVLGAGGNDVGPFQSELVLPPYPPIVITTSLPPGSGINTLQDFTVNWTGGRAGDTVHMKIITGPPVPGYCECTTPATTGHITLPAVALPSGTAPPRHRLPFPVYSSSNSEVEVFVQSEGDQTKGFTASGLTRGAHKWIYEWRFGTINF